MRILRAQPTDVETPLLVLQQFLRDERPQGPVQEVDARLGGEIARIIQRGDFHGREDETLLLYPRDGTIPAERILLVGVGKREDYTVESVRRAVGTAVRRAETLGVSRLSIDLGFRDNLSEHMGAYHASRAVAEAAVLASWDYRELKSRREDDAPRAMLESFDMLAGNDEEERRFTEGCAMGSVAARAENFARELATLPGNIATPAYLAERAQAMAADTGLACTVLDRAAMEEEGMAALLAVAQGSAQEPRLIVLEHRGGPDGQRPLVLVGKGVTFDTGGISIKPADKMEQMKYDMSGAAAVIGAMRGIAELGLEHNVVGVVPCAENMPSSTALKPGDVIRALSGKTIEIINTDAEGRLILADALAYAARFEPAAILDAATLTGAVVVALGNHAIGLMGNDGDLIGEVRSAGHRAGERCWPLPLWDEYRKLMDSDIADIKNSGGRAAGTITAGWFLKEFVGETPWAHLDIAGTAYGDTPPPYLRKGASGVPTRLFIEWVRTRAER
ncbi:MAG TPA: leucyl aminopeptidase [Longimicrobiales bacterium]|nr:leucyl aminopeptidase [Longimicrobiales bacterium]